MPRRRDQHRDIAVVKARIIFRRLVCGTSPEMACATNPFAVRVRSSTSAIRRVFTNTMVRRRRSGAASPINSGIFLR